jgi:hypothetical protein
MTCFSDPRSSFLPRLGRYLPSHPQNTGTRPDVHEGRAENTVRKS